MIGNEEGTGGTSTFNPTRLRPPRKPSRNGYTPPSRRSNPKPLPQKEDPGSNPSGHPHSCRKTHFCTVCGKPIVAGNHFCSSCGAPVFAVEDATTLAGTSGAPLAPAPPPPATTRMAPPPPPPGPAIVAPVGVTAMGLKGPSRKVLVVAGSAVLLIAIVNVFSWWAVRETQLVRVGLRDGGDPDSLICGGRLFVSCGGLAGRTRRKEASLCSPLLALSTFDGAACLGVGRGRRSGCHGCCHASCIALALESDY